jgi:hypothetical protein
MMKHPTEAMEKEDYAALNAELAQRYGFEVTEVTDDGEVWGYKVRKNMPSNTRNVIGRLNFTDDWNLTMPIATDQKISLKESEPFGWIAYRHLAKEHYQSDKPLVAVCIALLSAKETEK